MTTQLVNFIADPVHVAVLDELSRLGRQHRLLYRLQVGELLLQRFYAGDAAAYHNRASNKEANFKRFLEACREELEDLDLSEYSLRRAVVCKLAFATLPPAVRELLEYGHVLALTGVGDPTARAQLAKASVDGQWNVKRLKGAIAQFKAGRWYDTEPDTPGVQAPAIDGPAEPRGPKAQPGHLTNQSEKLVATAEQWAERVATVAPDRWSEEQKLRIRASITALRQRLQDVEAGWLRDDP